MKTLFVLSGKGGVGKTTFAVNLAVSLSLKEKKVGLLDIDLHGPNVPKMLGMQDLKINENEGEIFPNKYNNNLEVMSIGFMANKEDSIIWRGPMKHNMIQQFIKTVKWSNLDYLVVDFPPGTGDEQISAAQLLKENVNAIIISTPQEVSIIDSIRTINFCNEMKIPILGMVENMSGELFGTGNIKKICEEKNLNFIGNLNMSKSIVLSSDSGKPFILSENQYFEKLVLRIKELQS